MNLYIILHVSGPQVWYRASGKDLGGMGQGWTTNMDLAEVYTDADFPEEFSHEKMRLDVIDGKVALLGLVKTMHIKGTVTV